MEELISDYSRFIGKPFNVVQVGANDGITHDPIHKFIKRDRWNGVLVEPQKAVFDRYLSRIYKKHKNITVLNAAIGSEDGQAEIFKIGFSTSRWATGLTTFDRATLQKAFDSGHVQRKCDKEGIKIPEDTSTHIVAEKIQVLSTTSLIEQHHIQKIDLLMIDTEGFDFEIIKLFNISDTQPGLIIFEHSHLSTLDYEACEKLLQDNGYLIKKDGANTIALRKEINLKTDYFVD